MRVLVGCEFSGRVRDAFCRAGHDAWSCDTLSLAEVPQQYVEPQHFPSNHLTGDVRLFLNQDWDLGVFFPPCTFLSSSGARWWKDRMDQQAAALEFVQELMDAPIPHIALENPIGAISKAIRLPDQIIHPYMFGHDELKSTCLWLKNLPLLQPTHYHYGPYRAAIHREPPGLLRQFNRSLTYPGIAEAMPQQWGTLP